MLAVAYMPTMSVEADIVTARESFEPCRVCHRMYAESAPASEMSTERGQPNDGTVEQMVSRVQHNLTPVLPPIQ